MRVRWLVSLTALLLVLSAAACEAAQKEAAPAVVIRIRSLDAVLENAKLLINLTGEEAAARQIEGLLKAKAGPKGIEGIDPRRPLGAYVRFGKQLDEIAGAVLIPVANEKAFLDLLERLNYLHTKGKNNIYTIQTGKAFDLYFRFFKGYVYLSALNPDNLLDERLIDPEHVLVGKETSVFSTLVRLDQIPDGAKLLALTQLEEALKNLQDKEAPGETPAQKDFRLAVLREFALIGKSVLEQGAELRLDVGLEPAAKDFTVHLAMSGQPGTALAKSFQTLAKSRSPFASLYNKDAAFLGAIDASLPAPVQQAFIKVVDETMTRALSELRDAQKKKQAEQLFQALTPSLRAGQLDAFMAVLGPTDKLYTFISAVHLREGTKLGQTLHDLITEAKKELPEKEQQKIHLDVESVGAVKIHRFDLPVAPAVNKKYEELVAAKEIYVAFRDDAVFFALGKQALPALKEAIASREGSEAPVFLFNFDVPRMLPFLPAKPGQQELAQKIFVPGQESNLRIVVNGGNALTLRLQMKLSALEFLAKLKDSKRGE
jgi:ABC-type amino acid transport substrate-binding protein